MRTANPSIPLTPPPCPQWTPRHRRASLGPMRAFLHRLLAVTFALSLALLSGIENNAAAQAFLDAHAPQGLIEGTEGDPAYVDSNQTWFSATVDQYNNPLINYAHIADNADVYGVFADVQSALGGNIDAFQVTLLISNSEDLAALSPTQKVELIRAYDTAWQGRMAMLDPGLHDAYALMVGEMGSAAIRAAIHTMTDADWDSLPSDEQEYLVTILVDSYLNTAFTLPGGDGAYVRSALDPADLTSAKLREKVLEKIEATDGAGQNLGTGSKFADQLKLNDHFGRHGTDFGANSATEYEQMADAFLTGPKGPNTLEIVRPNGDIVRFDPTTDAFGVVSANGTIRTYYVPDPAVHGYSTNLDYFNAQ